MLVRREWYIGIECGIDFFDLKIAQSRRVIGAKLRLLPVSCYRGGIARHTLFPSSLAVRQFPALFFALFAIPLDTL
jgi:hypothetical protein